MSRKVASRMARVRSLGLAARAAVLSAVVIVLYAAVTPVAWYLSGPTGAVAAAAAAGVCLASASLALVVSHLLRDPKVALYGLLFGMALRMGIPLAFAMVVHFRGGGLADAGLMYYLLPFYLVALGVETVLTLPQTDPPGRHPEDPKDVA